MVDRATCGESQAGDLSLSFVWSSSTRPQRAYADRPRRRHTPPPPPRPPRRVAAPPATRPFAVAAAVAPRVAPGRADIASVACRSGKGRTSTARAAHVRGLDAEGASPPSGLAAREAVLSYCLLSPFWELVGGIGSSATSLPLLS